MSIRELIKLSEEFEQVIESPPETIRAPSTDQFRPKSGPVSMTRSIEDQPYESKMDYTQIANTLRNYTKDNFLTSNDRIGQIKPTDYAGLYFLTHSQLPAQSYDLYRKMQSFFSQLYPTKTTSGKNWVEMIYPEEETKVTFRHFGSEVTFKITTLD